MIYYIKFTIEAKEKIKKLSEELYKIIIDEEKENNSFTAWNVFDLYTLVSNLRRTGFTGKIADETIKQNAN